MDVRIRGTGIRTKQEEQREGYRQIIIEEAIATLNIKKKHAMSLMELISNW